MASEDTMELDPTKSYHLMGIGGIGMSGLAGVLAERGFRVSGSDNRDGPVLQRLRDLGVTTVIGQTDDGAAGADVAVRSTAVRDTNPEYIGARERNIPVYHRSQLLAAVLEGHRKVAVTGTHGKTTATSLLGSVLITCGRDPMVIVGGDAPDINGNYRLGSEALAVFEACESDNTFHRYGACSQLVTNVEADHLDEHHTYQNLQNSFRRFIGLVPDDGFLVYCADSPDLVAMADEAAGKRISYGVARDAQVTATDVREERFGVTFRAILDGIEGPEIKLCVPGLHNVANALGVLATARELGVDVSEAARAMADFHGVGRRFERLGELSGALVVDDYAHHPTEVAATLTAARDGFNRRVIAIFQPHLFSRTRDFMEEFARALTAADVVIVASIYAAREEPIEGVDAGQIAERLRVLAPDMQVQYMPDQGQIADRVREIAGPNDLIITLGAGDIRRVAETLARGGLTV